MARRPCCCIPNRAATIVVSLLSIILSSFFLAGAFIIISTNALTKALIIPAVIWALGFTLLFVSSWVGFIGSIMRKRRAVAFYAVILMILWVVTLIVGLWNIIVIFKNKQTVIDGCTKSLYADAPQGEAFDSKAATDECTHAHTTLAAVVTVVWVVYQLLALWIISTVFALRRELIDKAMADKRAVEESYTTGPSTTPAYLQRTGTFRSTSSRNSEESKMSTRSGQVVSVPYRPSNQPPPLPVRNAPMGSYNPSYQA